MSKVLDVGTRPADRIGNYRVEVELGPTGTGVLLQAHHLVLPRRAILKVVHTAFAAVKSFVVQTLREACILEAIAHPGIPVVYESGVLRDRRPWFAFEWIRGPTLEQHLAGGALGVPEVAALVRDLVDIFEHVHRRGVIHRGLRPDRVVITADRRYPLCVPDWSEAIAHDAAAQDHPIWEGVSHYVAPELARQVGSGTVEHIDDRVDMFALGVIAYRALTGRLPYDGSFEPPVPAHDLRRNAPRELAQLIDSLLAFDRFARPSAAELRADIDWLFATLPGLQRRAAPEGSQAEGSSRVRIEPRLRRPRWTPEVGYRETTDVEIASFDDRDGARTT